MEKLKENILVNLKIIIKRGTFSLIIPLISIIYIVLNKYNPDARVLSIFIDNLIPFNKYFIVFYLSWYTYVALCVIYFCIYDKEDYWKLLISLITGMLISYFIYYTFPTTVPRPNLTGSDMFTNMVKALYKNDEPFNCFPSIHVLNTLLVQFYLTKNKNASMTFIIIYNIIGTLIILSTMFIKQHVILDAAGAALLAIFIYQIINYIFKRYNISNKLL